MYKNIYKDPETAFIVDKIISESVEGVELLVTWYKKDNSKYVAIDYQGEFFIPKNNILHYIKL